MVMPVQEEHTQCAKPASTNGIRYTDSVKQVNTQISPERCIASIVVQGSTEYKLVLLVNPLASTEQETVGHSIDKNLLSTINKNTY